jgi:2-C-methyl-D-erythritol 4-phosphate cytidylyltransferase/2-C-methyl-D-erythritol 2,4-cyclodiphosphate synthase
MTVSVIVVAAGSGERLGATRPKAFVDVAGKTLLEHSLSTLNQVSHDLQVVVVAPEKWLGAAEELARVALDPRHLVEVVSGGMTRSDSVRAGLGVLRNQVTTVLIHDAARALCPPEVFSRVIDALDDGAVAVIPTVDVVDTLSPIDHATGITGPAVDRSSLASVQTPQGFRKDVISSAHEAFPDNATDDADIARRAGHQVVSVAGDARAFKITHPADLERAQQLLARPDDVRVGVATDVHAYDPNIPLWLGGVHWPGEPGLSGHSDGDVVVHVICDALLQAASLGDMGTLFGVSKPEFEGANSRIFLDTVLSRLADDGFSPRSVSCQLVANTPRFASRREEISQLLTGLVGAPVHVACTTSDGLGFTGRGEGMAAFAVALVARHGSSTPSSK